MRITPDISIRDDEVELTFVRSSGPGGQNVNKVSTAAQLRFDAANSPSLPEEVRHRLLRLAGNAVTSEGILIIDARRHRSQARNRQDALDRLADLIRMASIRPKPRRRTRPTAGSRARRLQSKKARSNTKSLRGLVREKDIL